MKNDLRARLMFAHEYTYHPMNTASSPEKLRTLHGLVGDLLAETKTDTEPVDVQYKCFKKFDDGEISVVWMTESDLVAMYGWQKCTPEEKRNLYAHPPQADAEHILVPRKTLEAWLSLLHDGNWIPIREVEACLQGGE